ncbi:hypothetical protein C8T65DRAFT_743637 [Cerioporus squamosus]|nr:hypothetical protein C8T65DRAFT_743637 [Cerioporus squamosus]
MSPPGGGQLFANHKGWGALANELRVRILGQLDATDLVSCIQVAQAFKTLVDETPSLRYKLLLHATGMRDAPPGGSSVSKRLASLAEYERTWKEGNIPIRRQPNWSRQWGGHWGGGLFITLDRDQFQLDIRRSASFFSGVPEKVWTVDLSEFSEQDEEGSDLEVNLDLESSRSYHHIVDLAQDLLVLMVLPENDPEEYPECYVLSLSQNGATHPLAARRQLYDGSSLGFSNPQADLEIVGDLVGCTVVGMDICMSVYNWKTGQPLWFDSELDDFGDINEMEYHTRCHILDSTHLLKISKYDLTVHRMERGPDGQPACILGMPTLAEGFVASYCSSSIQRPPETPDCSPHFECDPSLTVLVVEYDVRHESSGQNKAMLVLVVPITTILAQVHGPQCELSWEDWGALGARLVLVPYQNTCSANIDAFGSRVAVSVSIPGRSVEVAVLDVRKGLKRTNDHELGAKPEGTSPLVVLDRFTKEDTPIFDGPVEAKMSYRMVTTQLDASQSRSGVVSLLCDGLCI